MASYLNMLGGATAQDAAIGAHAAPEMVAALMQQFSGTLAAGLVSAGHQDVADLLSSASAMSALEAPTLNSPRQAQQTLAALDAVISGTFGHAPGATMDLHFLADILNGDVAPVHAAGSDLSVLG